MAVGTELISQSLRTIVVAALAHLVLIAPTLADDQRSGLGFGKNADYWEVRFGGGAYDFGPATPTDYNGGVVNFEVLAPSPDFLERIGSPRPYLGTDIAISDDAQIHVIYAGLNWEAYVTRRLYFGFGGGGSWNTGPRVTSGSGDTKDLGYAFLFHLQASIGFDITETMTMQIFLNHISNANISVANPGLESVGGRIGVRF